VSEVAGREFGEVYMTWAGDPPDGPKLRIAAAAERVLITVPLLALRAYAAERDGSRGAEIATCA
jgi:hypothetical protein